ncbi:MAG TPA: carbon starvation protein A [Candidatus Nanoarchaeia archaeon]|nr:carbon starvation protein A [Candidatus Nanoarchaeia archaeon]
MNSIWILIAIALWMFLGYRFYSKFIEKKLKINDKNITPAVKQRDNIDYSPAKKPFLIGHHFASIAGAGPIIGPILAVSYFGWLPVVLWVSIGGVFIGAMHDYVTLIVSVRNKAKGVSNIAKHYLGSKGGWLFGLMIWITLILITTVFSVSAAESIISKPDLVIPLLTITIIAVVLGLITEKTKVNYKLISLIGIIVVFASIWAGLKYPISLNITNPALLRNIWITIILIYAGIASILPVWVLLRPRDYMSAMQMLVTLLLGFLAIIIVRPIINAPAYISSDIFPLWPILFITVACGAVSGFHGLVSSGTTSKQLAKESHGRAIGYGGMILESLLAILVTIVVIAGLKWGVDFGEESFQLALNKGWIVLFSTGFGNIVGKLGIPLITTGIAALLGAFMVNQFILTSVDTSTRLGRYVLSENLTPFLKNRILTTIITLVPAWLLAVTNSYDTLWRLFGSSNQLIASISLMVVASFFISTKKNVKFIVIPAIFILITTLSALVYLTFRAGGYLQAGNYVLAAISMAMFILGLFVAYEGLIAITKNKSKI